MTLKGLAIYYLCETVKAKYSIILLTGLFFSQLKAQNPSNKKAALSGIRQSVAIDTLFGMNTYNKLIEVLAGDSSRYSKDGNLAQGWIEDTYASGKPLHKGFYKNGKLVLFKNFFENGQCERNFQSNDPINSVLDIFYEDGTLHRQVTYYNGIVKKVSDFYLNNIPKRQIEFSKDQKYLVLEKSWFSDGNLALDFKLGDLKTKKYQRKSYYPNGVLKEEGNLVYSYDTKLYYKTGLWYSYDAFGKNKHAEKFNPKSIPN